MPALLAHHALATPDEHALSLEHRRTTRVVSWAELQREVERNAAEFAKLGFVAGSVLLVLGDLSLAWLGGVLAAHRLGGTVVSMPANARDGEVTTSLQHVPIRFVYAAKRDLPRVSALRPLLGSDCIVLSGLEPHADQNSQSRVAEQAPPASSLARNAHDCTIVPAFLAFEKRASGESIRRVIHHCTLVHEAERGLDLPGQELSLAPSSSCSVDRFVALAGWLSFGSHRHLRGMYD